MTRRRGHTEEQIPAALRQAESETTVLEVWREVGLSELRKLRQFRKKTPS